MNELETYENPLEYVEPMQAEALFQDAQALDKVLSWVQEQVIWHEDLNLEKEADRKLLKSEAYKIARVKTCIDNKGKDLGEEYRTRLNALNTNRKKARDFCEGLQEQILEPLKEREDRINAEMEAERQKKEQEQRAKDEELERLRAAERAREEEDARKAREAEIARQAAERARMEVEERAWQTLGQTRQDLLFSILPDNPSHSLHDLAKMAENEFEEMVKDWRRQARERAEQERQEAEERARQKERERIAHEQALAEMEREREEGERQAREQDEENRERIHEDIRKGLVYFGISGIDADNIVRWISDGALPHVSIDYSS